MPSFDLNIQFLHFPAKGAWGRVYLPPNSFRIFRAQAFVLRSTGLSVKEIAKKLEKSICRVVKWLSRNVGFEDKKRTGRPKVLNEVAKKLVLKKAKYKRGNSTRHLSQPLASEGLVGGKNAIWRLMKSEGWRPLRQQKKPLLTTKQRAARLKFA